MIPKYFSLIVFAFTQVVIDFETLYFMLKNEYPLHRFCHTFLGATVIMIVSIYLVRPICRACFNIRISYPAAFVAAVFGCYTQVIFDAVMHADVRPFAPFSDMNPLHRLLELGLLHAMLILAGLIGGIVLIIRYMVRKQD